MCAGVSVGVGCRCVQVCRWGWDACVGVDVCRGGGGGGVHV